ncbi:ankyrin repeat and fibronectin type-III domain-containing protein 1-like isoform X2 [Ornithodoros turicata]|uniref:ankyrin repeat and fibronectin type-III domain-containing protein 1-like isoform X2 n=1 Tax=Ornithodoros turicata TaxID=34597 RepID=UPI0031392E4C
MSNKARRMHRKVDRGVSPKLDCLSYPILRSPETCRRPVRVIVECPHSEDGIDRIMRKGRDFCRSLTPDSQPRLCVGSTVRAKSLSPAKVRRPSAGTVASASLPNGKCRLLVEDEEAPHKSPCQSPRHSVSSTGSACSSQGSKDTRQEHGGSQRVGLAKLARLLIQKSPGGSSPTGTVCSPPTSDASMVSRPGLRRSASIDSLLDSVLPSQGDFSGEDDATSQCTLSTLAVPPTHGGHRPSQRRALPTSPSVPSKLAKGVPGYRQAGVELLLDGLSLGKSERKKLEKLNKFNIDLQALFAAVEHHHVDRARSILESTNIDVNSVNTDGFTALDVAVMTGEASLVRLLQNYGAREGPRWTSAEARASQLTAMLREAQRCVEDLTACVASASANAGSLSTALLREKERQLALWERRLGLISEMKTGFEELRPPDPPGYVSLEVVGTRALRVTFSEPESAAQAPTLVTKYLVEYCENEAFSSSVGSMEVTDVQKLEFTIPELSQGVPYFVRVAAGNGKGFSDFQISDPQSATPSSWRDVEERVPRWKGCTERLEYLFQQITESHHAATSADFQKSGSSVGSTSDLADGSSSRRPVRKSIRNLFSAAPKFQKTLKRGIYLASLLYNEDRVLVTTEETLPILEVDDVFPPSLHTEFHWLVKVGCTWEDVKTLRQDMEKSHSSSNVHFRSKLLLAVEQMQSALGIQDLGQLYYKPLRDYEGTTTFCVIKYVEEPKCINTLSVRWLPLAKIQRRMPSVSDGGEPSTATELLTSALQEMMTYHQVSNIPLPRGLYLGYLKLKSSMDLISVLVPYKNPNMLPYCKIRNNQHVSCEEWQWLKSLGQDVSEQTANDMQLKFQRAISAAAKTLFSQLEISQELYNAHRVYDMEVVELSSEVSLLLVLPPVEEVCCVPGQRDELTSRADCLTLPVQMFEAIHLRTYQPPFIACYARVSSILEMDTMLAQHANREAFSSTEVATARGRLAQLQSFQAQVEQTWRATRWIMDALTYARNRSLSAGLQLSAIWRPGDPPTPTLQLTAPILPPISVRRVSRVDDLIDAKMFLGPPVTTSASLGVSGGLEIRRCASASQLILSGDHEEVAKECRSSNTDSASSAIEDDYTDNDAPISVMCPSLRSPDALIPEDDGARNLDASYRLSGPGVLRIYAAYDCGLPTGTSMKIHVTEETTAREVIELFVRQLNTAVRVKGKDGPIYGEERFGEFCLVAVVGSRERCLSDDYEPLRLQNPWTKGKLFVKLRDEEKL